MNVCDKAMGFVEVATYEINKCLAPETPRCCKLDNQPPAEKGQSCARDQGKCYDACTSIGDKLMEHPSCVSPLVCCKGEPGVVDDCESSSAGFRCVEIGTCLLSDEAVATGTMTALVPQKACIDTAKECCISQAALDEFNRVAAAGAAGATPVAEDAPAGPEPEPPAQDE
jgi:hypothetical protein